MAEIVRMPKLSDTMTEGVVAKWHKNIGDQVEEGQLLAEIETDKATMEFESFQDGVLLYQGVEEGKAAPVDSILAIFGEKGEDYAHLLKGDTDAPTEAAEEPAATEAAPSKEAAPAIDTSGINAMVISMPKLSDTMTEGVVAKWHKKVGDQVSSGELLAEIESDKATMEFESYEDGELLHIGVDEGQSAPVDSVLAIIGEKGSDYKTLIAAHDSSMTQEAQVEEPAVAAPTASVGANAQPAMVAAQPAKIPTPSASSSNGRILASPLAKKLAADKGINLSAVKGSGDHGRIIKRDIENYTPAMGGASMASMVEGYTDADVTQMRKAISRSLSGSKFSAPHFYLTITLDMENAIAARKAINETIEGKISFNDMVIKAAALALKKHPSVNSAWYDTYIRTFDHTHIGVAVAVEDGLLVPVVQHANAKSFLQINEEVKALAGKARNKTLQPHEWEGSTFTISNLGMFGIEEFTAIINPPNACILAVGGIQQVPVVKNNAIVPGNTMKVTLSCDHRVVDGATGAEFLATFRTYMENPITMFI